MGVNTTRRCVAIEDLRRHFDLLEGLGFRVEGLGCRLESFNV